MLVEMDCFLCSVPICVKLLLCVLPLLSFPPSLASVLLPPPPMPHAPCPLFSLFVTIAIVFCPGQNQKEGRHGQQDRNLKGTNVASPVYQFLLLLSPSLAAALLPPVLPSCSSASVASPSIHPQLLLCSLPPSQLLLCFDTAALLPPSLRSRSSAPSLPSCCSAPSLLVVSLCSASPPLVLG